MFVSFKKFLLLVLGAHLALSITTQLNKKQQFCTYKRVPANEYLVGEYVVSGFTETKFVATVFSANDNVIYKSENKREGAWEIVSTETEDYKICFQSLDSKQKAVSFNIAADNKEEEKNENKEAITSGIYYL